MQTNDQTKKLTSTAGPIQTSKANKALQKLQRAGAGTLEICDYGTFVTSTFGDRTEAEKAVSAVRLEKLNAIKEAYAYTITAENFKAFIADCEAAAAELEKMRPVIDKRTTTEQREAAARLQKEREEKAAIEREEQTAKEAAERQTVCALWPDLEQVKPGGYADQTLAARNIRKELKKKFPGVKFSVTSESYSMGDNVNVKWQDGPTIKQVESITDKYSRGSFNSMEDIYEDDKEGRAFTSVFGGTKYLFTDRTVSAPIKEKILSLLETRLGESFGAAGSYERKENLARVMSDALRETDLTGKGDIIGIGLSPNKANVWQIDFKQAPAPAQAADCQGATDCGGVKIGRYMHTKKGREFSLVQLENKVAAETFNSLLGKARTLGGWYSRAWGATPGGFAFWDADKAADFAAGLIK